MAQRELRIDEIENPHTTPLAPLCAAYFCRKNKVRSTHEVKLPDDGTVLVSCCEKCVDYFVELYGG